MFNHFHFVDESVEFSFKCAHLRVIVVLDLRKIQLSFFRNATLLCVITEWEPIRF
jgi:hypothetical protein